MKKIDKLVFGSFIGPFLLTLVVVDFILLLVSLIKYFDKIFGKGLGMDVYLELFSYFSISASPDAFPLAVLLSSIMAFGNLGEHSELTALKSSGISLIRTLFPLFIFVLFLTGLTYYSNTHLVPKSNLKTYRLLWDMRTKKPTLDIKEGVFYTGIPGYTIKINQKIGDEQLKDLIIYDHTIDDARGNRKVILADSGRMYSFMNQRYLALELYDGASFEENIDNTYESKQEGGKFIREKFQSSVIRFDLSSFDMGKTDEDLFRRSRLVLTREELKVGVDSMEYEILKRQEQIFQSVSTNTFRFHFVNQLPIPAQIAEPKAIYDSIKRQKDLISQMTQFDKQDSLIDKPFEEQPLSFASNDQNQKNGLTTHPTQNQGNLDKQVSKSDDEQLQKDRLSDIQKEVKRLEEYYVPTSSEVKIDNSRMSSALNFGINQSRTARNLLNSRITSLENIQRDQRKFEVTRNQQIAKSFACLIMFLIGAPIGAIIKKGGLGLPVIVSVIFFLVYYVLNTTGDKWGKEGVLDPAVAVWISNAALLPIGLFFLKQARRDARLFEVDAYVIFWERLTSFFKRKRKIQEA